MLFLWGGGGGRGAWDEGFVVSAFFRAWGFAIASSLGSGGCRA